MLKGQPPVGKGANDLKVFGSFFYPEMRTIVAILDLNSIPYTLEQIEMLTAVGQKEYLGVNPGQSVPTLIEGY